MFASSTSGAVSWLNYAFRFLQLPIGVFGVAIATVTTTRFAEAAADRDREAMGSQLMESLRLVAFLTVPATVGLMVLGEPIIRLIFERGKFDAGDTLATTMALEYFAIGLVSYAAVKVLAPAFYATDQARIPMIASMTAVAGNLILNITLHQIYGWRILALGTAIAALLNFGMLYVMFDRRVQRFHHLALLAYLIRIGVAAGIMGLACWGSYQGILESMGSNGLAARAAGALGPITVGILVYAAACWVLRVEELAPLWRRLRRRA
jgi:putative peptidoglycan lipid II flippase